MAHSRSSRGFRRGPLLDDQARATAREFAAIAMAICIIVIAAFHLIGINPGKILAIAVGML